MLDSLFEANQKAQQEESRLEKAASSRVIFTPQELNKMPQKFRKIFKTNKVYAHVRRRSNGLYEIRYQINHTRISVTAKHLDTCKERFIEKLNEINLQYNVETIKPRNTKSQTPLIPYMQKWLETVKKNFHQRSYIQGIHANGAGIYCS